MAGTFLPPGLTTSDVKIASGGTDNYVMTAVDGETIQGEDKLTFDGSTLTLDGDLTFTGAQTITTSAGNLSIDAYAGSAIRLNDARANVDVVIESDAADNLFHADATLGAVGINVAASGTRVFEVGGSFTSTGQYFGAYFTTLGTIVGSNDASHLWVNAGITGASGATHDVISTARFEEPAITVNSSTINHTATVYITGAAHEAGSSQNYALWVDAGESRFDGDMFQRVATAAGVERAVIHKDGIADDTATALFTITTTNESGNTDDGAYTCFIKGMIGHRIDTDTGDPAVKGYSVAFARCIAGNGDGANTAVTDPPLYESAEAGSGLSTRGITDVEVTVAETSEYVQTISIQITDDGSSVDTFEVTFEVEVIWAEFLTPPVIAASA